MNDVKVWTMTTGTRVLMALGAAGMLAGCTLGPDYSRPDMAVPPAFKENAAATVSGDWVAARPGDLADRGAWWRLFRDPVLDGLAARVAVSNQTLKANQAAYAQAVAALRGARAGFMPTLTLDPSVDRGKSGKAKSRTSYDVGVNASWEADLWGRIRRDVESETATAQASAADLAAARLSLQGTLVTTYLQLRVADELKRLLDESAAAYAVSLQITQNQYRSGVASRADVAQAETQLKSTQASAINVEATRAQLEHAIAVLVGEAPATFSLAPAPLARVVPVVPAGVPSTLLQRRPDIAAAERRVAAANARIGVATAGYYPSLTLSGALDFAGTALTGLFGAANRVWSIGPGLSQTLFDGGSTSASVEEARAAWDEAVATYRETVLEAFQKVEDELANLTVLERQAAVQAEAVASAQEAERLILNQYRAGTVAYTSVVTAQATALSNEQSALTVLESRLIASVALVQALGGGWDDSQLPAEPGAGPEGSDGG